MSGLTQNPQQLLADDHEALNRLLSALVEGFEGREIATTFARLDLFWARLAMHIRAENLHLFPKLLQFADKNAGSPERQVIDAGNLRQALEKLRGDHDFFMHQLAISVQLMRELLASSDRTNQHEMINHVHRIIDSVSTRLAAHNRLEEEFVYQLPSKILCIEDQTMLAAEIQRELENVPPRFAKGWDTSKG